MRLSILYFFLLSHLAIGSDSVIKVPKGLRDALLAQISLDHSQDKQELGKAIEKEADKAIEKLGIYLKVSDGEAARIDNLTFPEPSTVQRIQEEKIIIQSYLANRPLPYRVQDLAAEPAKLSLWQAELTLRLYQFTKHIIQRNIYQSDSSEQGDAADRATRGR